jgi:hypothetical protein
VTAPLPPLFGRHSVKRTAEFDRIFRLPRRDWEHDAARVAADVTEQLRTPAGAMRLHGIQAVALKELYECGGLVGGLAVGEGKTLLSLLAPYVVEAERPMLVLPAKLIDKTKRERDAYAAHWKIPNYTKLESYERLGRVSGKQILTHYCPDLLIFDEAHKLKDTKHAAVARRVKRYVEERRRGPDAPAPPDAAPRGPLIVVILSGTITRVSIRDYEHLVKWALPGAAPLPERWTEIEDWANALDDLKNPLARVDPGALRALVEPEDAAPREDGTAPDELTIVRRAYARRLVQTPGIVSSRSTDLGTSLQIDGLEHTPSKPIDDAFELLRTAWVLPDFWELIDGAAVWAHARQLALGFYYVWDPRPPQAWIEARLNWTRFARQTIKASRAPRVYDSELDVALNFPGAPEYVAWAAIRNTFKPNTVARWICRSALETCAAWADGHPRGIVWVEHREFGLELERLTDIPYFHEMGCSSTGQYIEDAKGPVIASVKGNRDGRNLQYKWQDNLVTASPSAGLDYEQLLGRTHRQGQKADTVTADVFLGCVENARAFEKARITARYESDSTRQRYKLCYADTSVPSEADVWTRGAGGPSAHRWRDKA